MRFLKDPWKSFTFVAILTGIFLIIIPQLWIATSSLYKDKGSVIFKTTADSFTVVTDTIDQFDVQPIKDNNYLLNIDKNNQWALSYNDANSLILTAENPFSSPPKYDAKSNNKYIITINSDQFEIRQDVALSLFSQQSTLLSFENIDNQNIRITHNPKSHIGIKQMGRQFSLLNYWRFFTEKKYFQAFTNSLLVTFVATFLSTIFAVPLAWLVARHNIKGRKLIITLVTMASISPPFLGAYAWRMLLGGNGILTNWFHLDASIVGIHGVIWVITFLVFPLIFLLSLNSFTSLDISLKEAATSLGAKPKKTFFNIEIPLAMPGVITGIYMASMAAFSDFGTPYIISVDLKILPVLIYNEFLSESGSNISMASTASMIMLFISSLLLTAQRIYISTKAYANVAPKRIVLEPATPIIKMATYSLAFFTLFMAFIPHFTVGITSFMRWSNGILKNEFTFDNYLGMFQKEFSSVFISLSTSITASIFCLFFGIGIAYVLVRKQYKYVSNALNIIIMLPYIIPGTVFAIGFIMLFNNKPILLTGTWFILVLCYFIRRLSFSVKTAESILYQVHPATEEAAISLGASPLRSFWQITFPLMLTGALTGTIIVFLRTMTELSSTILLYKTPWKPMTAVIFEYAMNSGADFGIAAAMSVFLMLILYIPLYLITIKTRK